MIEVNDLHKSFGKVKVLNGIHLEYHPGKISVSYTHLTLPTSDLV
mgnify:CR=1 FL=1